MKSAGILFQADMIRALLRTQNPKTQTRRIMDPQPVNRPIFCTPETTIHCDKPAWYDADGVNPGRIIPCRFGAPGDELWAKETFGLGSKNGICHAADEQVFYRATDPTWDEEETGFKWTPSIFMPKEASRITLVIDNIRAERVSAISEADAIAEGIEPHSTLRNKWRRYDDDCAGGFCDTAALAYRSLWNHINAKPQPVYGRDDAAARKFISYYIAYPWALEDMHEVKGVTDIRPANKTCHATATYRGMGVVIHPDPYVWAITFHRKP